MSADEVVDLRTDRFARRRRIWLRVGLPIAGVALLILTILAIALYSARANRGGVLILSDELLAGLQSRVADQVKNYLDRPAHAVELARAMLPKIAPAEQSATFQALAAGELRQIPQIDAIYEGDGGGNFLMVTRGEAGGINVKTIRNSPGTRQVELVRRDAEGRVVARELEPKDSYDPRQRDWYQGALKADGVFWSGVYIFFTTRAPGVTAALRDDSSDGAGRVFGVDVTLSTLSDFLASLRIGRGGRAVIFDADGRLIAAPDMENSLLSQNGQLIAPHLDQLGDPVLTGAFDRFRVEGYGTRLISIGEQPIISIVTPLPAAGRNWSLLIAVPENDFTGFVAANSRKTLILSLGVVAIAAILAALLVRQGLAADRTARLLLDRGETMARQGAAFATLARQANLFDPSEEAPARALTETLAETSSARRASIWRMLGNSHVLRCEDAYERDSGGHVSGLELSSAEMPQFFAALNAGEDIAVADAANDRRTAELHRAVMHSFDSRRLLIAPIHTQRGVAGAVILEDAAGPAESRDFVRAVANMLALRIGGQASDAPAMGITEPIKAERVAAGDRSFAAELTLRGMDPAVVGTDVFPSVAVMVIKFTDPAAMAARQSSEFAMLVDRIAASLQDIADAHDIPYLKLVGQDVVAAAGCAPEDTSAITRIADAALASREHCLTLFEELELPAAFRVGIDYGIAIGSQVGRQPRLFNLWGEAVRTADVMAASSAVPGGIQASEAAYRRLRQNFLFRPRGTFYLPRIGSAQTFILASRL